MTSIRGRLFVSLLALLLLAAAVMGAAAYRNVLAETEAILDYQLQQMALSLRDQGEIAPAQVDTLVDEKLDVVVQIWSVDGRRIYASRAHSSLPARAVLGLATLNVQGRAWRTVSVATSERVIQVAQPVEIRKRLAAGAAWRSVLPLLLIAPVAALVVGWLAARNLAPLERLAAEVRARSALSLAPLATTELPDEVAPLAQSLDALLERLRDSLDTQRAFVADAAHELRSPLTALKLQLGLLRRAGSDGQRAAAQEALASGIERASRLVEQLLSLARSERPATIGTELVDLAEIARRAVADTVPFAASRQVHFELHAGAPVPLRGDALSLGVLVRNLADNAARYAPPGSLVVLRVVGADGAVGAATLQVDDAGPGIPQSERGRVFDRFYRRSAEGEAGSGLGLAIVRNIASAHGGSVELGASPAGGLRATVRLPVGPPAAPGGEARPS